jgi:hypothetical protein
MKMKRYGVVFRCWGHSEYSGPAVDAVSVEGAVKESTLNALAEDMTPTKVLKVYELYEDGRVKDSVWPMVYPWSDAVRSIPLRYGGEWP